MPNLSKLCTFVGCEFLPVGILTKVPLKCDCDSRKQKLRSDAKQAAGCNRTMLEENQRMGIDDLVSIKDEQGIWRIVGVRDDDEPRF
jgi:hypothetical protein